MGGLCDLILLFFSLCVCVFGRVVGWMDDACVSIFIYACMRPHPPILLSNNPSNPPHQHSRWFAVALRDKAEGGGGGGGGKRRKKKQAGAAGGGGGQARGEEGEGACGCVYVCVWVGCVCVCVCV